MKNMKDNKKKNGLEGLWTAEKTNEKALWLEWHEQPCWDEETTEEEIECTVPDVETAKEYVRTRKITDCYYEGYASLLDRNYSSQEIKELDKQVKKFKRMHLDMRDQIIIGDNGKKGLRDVCGNIIIEPQFDEIPELYSCFERSYLIPVVLDKRYYLYDHHFERLLTKGYERIFRYFWTYIDYFVAVENGKKGILHCIHGTEETPVIMDEIYSTLDPDAAVPFEKDGKVGFLWSSYTGPIFDKVRIDSEEYTRVELDGKWGWIDVEGKFTPKKSKAAFGSWYDFDK